MEAGAIYVKIGAKLEPLDKAMRAVNTKLKAFEAKTAAVANRIERFANNTIKRTGLIAAALSGVGVVSVKMAGDFERAMVRVAAVSQATSRQFRELKEAALSYAGATEYNAKQVAEGMTFMAMAGFKAEQTIKAMPSVLQLATAGMIDLGAAADITTNILTGYGMATEDLAKVNDVLVSAMTGANVDLRMLGESFKYAGPVAKGAGVAFEEAATAIALMGNAGIQGSMAGTALRTAISRLLNPTKSVEKLLRRLGVETKTAGGQLRSLTSIIGDLERAGATTADMMEIFGDRAGPAMAALVEQGAAAMAEFTARLRDSEGIAARIERDLLNTWPGQWDLLKGEIEGIAITLGNDLLPYMKVLVNLAAQLIGRFQGLDKEQRLQILRWVAVTGAVVGVVTAFGLLVAGTSLVMKSLTLLTGIIGLITSPWLIGISLIVGALVVLYTAWTENWGGIRDKTKEAYSYIEPVLEWLHDKISQAWVWTINAAGSAWKWLKDTTWQEKWDDIKSWMQQGWNWIMNRVGDGWAWLEERAPWLTGSLETVWNWTARLVGDAWTWLRDTAWPWISATAETVWSWTARLAGDAWAWLIESAWPWLRQAAATTWNWSLNLGGKFFDWLREIAWPWLAKTAETVWGWTVEITGRWFDWLRETAWPWIYRAVSQSWSWTIWVGGKFFDWLRETAWPWLAKTAETTWNWVVDLSGKFLDWLREVAWPWINQTVRTTWKWTIEGLEWLQNLISGKSEKEIEVLLDPAKAAEKFSESTKGAEFQLVAPPPSTWDKVKDVFWSIVNPVKDAFKGVTDQTTQLSEREKQLIARMVQAEAELESFEGKVAVAAVILNRLQDPRFPNTVEGVLSQKGQFEPYMEGGRFHQIVEANTEALEAVEAALRGWDPTGGALFFYNPKIVMERNAANWVLQHTKPIVDIGRHRFAGLQSGTPWTGWGPTNEVAGVVHRREAVIPWEALRKGPAGVLEFLGVPGFQVGRGRGALRSVAAVDPNLAIDLERQQTMLDSLTRTLSAIPRLLLEGITRILNLLGNAVVFAVEKLFGEEKAQELRQFIANLSEEAKRLLEAFTHVGDEAEEVALKFGRLDSELREPMGPPLTGWQRFIKWLKEQGRQINQAFEEIDWRETIQVALNAVSAELQNSGNAVADAVGEMVSHIRLAFSETGEIVIDWVSTIQNALNSLVTMVLTSLTRLLFGDYGAEYRGLTKEGKETFPDLSAMITNYKNWDKNLETLKDLQRKIDRNTVIGAGVGAIAGFLIGGPVGAILGGLFGGTVARKTSQKSYEKDIANLQAKLGDTFQKIKETLSTTLSDIADSLARAFSAETFENFVAQFSHNLEQQTKQALIMAFMAGEVMRPLLDKLSNVITMAVFDGLIDATERETIVSLYKDITDKASDFYESLKELGIATGEVADGMRKVGEALRNVPSGFKIALRRFGAAEPVPLAEGGIVTRPTLALVGESGPEAVIPLAGNAAGVTVKVTVNGSIYADDFEDRVARAVATGSRRAGLGRYGLAGGRA